jgi:hypothetical protein
MGAHKPYYTSYLVGHLNGYFLFPTVELSSSYYTLVLTLSAISWYQSATLVPLGSLSTSTQTTPLYRPQVPL